jgi:energy-coupling factor transport system permease protein
MHGTLFVPGESGLHQLHPLTKLTFAFLFLVVAATLPDLPWLLGAFAFPLIPLVIWGRLFPRFIKSTGAVILPFVISLSVIQGFFTPGETPLFQIGSFVFTLEGWLAGLTVAARILLAVGGALVLMLATRPDMLMLALTQKGFPSNLAYVVLTSIQIFPRFQERAQVILEAQQARGLEIHTNIFRRLRLLVPLVGPLVLSSIVDVEERAMALEARAFSRPGSKTSLLVLRDSGWQHLVRWALVIMMLGLVSYRVWRAFAS